MSSSTMRSCWTPNIYRRTIPANFLNHSFLLSLMRSPITASALRGERCLDFRSRYFVFSLMPRTIEGISSSRFTRAFSSLPKPSPLVEAGILDSRPRDDSPVVARHQIDFLGPQHAIYFQFIRAQRGHLSFCRTYRRIWRNPFDRRRKAACGDDCPRGFHFFILQNQAGAAILLPPNRFCAVSRKNLGTAVLRRFQNGRHQRAVVDGCFVRSQGGGFGFFAQRWLKLTGIFCAQRLSSQSQPVVQRDNRAELRFGVVRKQRLERPLGPKACVFSRNLFDFRNKFRIKRQARLSQWHHHNHPRTFRRRRKNPRAGPGRFLPRLLTIKDRHAQTGARQL